MTAVRLVETPQLGERQAWNINGEYIVVARRLGASTSLAVSTARSREVQRAAEREIAQIAAKHGVLVRTEAAIDCVLAFLDGDPQPIVDELALRRFEDVDREHVTMADGQLVILRQLAASDGVVSADDLDDDQIAQYLPLGCLVRTALNDLQERGAIRLERRRGAPPRWHLTATGRAILDAGGDTLDPLDDLA